ncbi:MULTISPECIES: hypothetical protein [Clostridium]|uniref:Uncharacterized protein n=1 Tax=Clostridium saccharoperbutylacetonicum N1-4(HMT) TaxID=931276 RepID=M1MRT3_9CLOT|nr:MULTISPECIES: hypothetical protein [Clostridium]AGF57461.1 hypothetical protein Cspa_c37010 [Clostridium saccharoperbutylacetonicum N1-4(HMT)]AQR96156.1 hypothetical protein CLSAP_34750 [Clostridium saccharoperbutylacetonicum]NRT61773.1 hypothetical protein [Clostridium saccharoperbutylacetonicum]NSB25097.1 hypothetical protein [Clostridium saccharoperbutylacetonicum]NSB32027.1 hypothetical protein [Clostridium saccharoperbutylacetonicum]
MDIIFGNFKNWINSKKELWKEQGLIMDEIIESTHAHQIHINLHSNDGFGHIGLFESNNIYWVEFEATAREFEDFYRYFEFERLPCFDNVEQEYIRFITLREDK